MVPTALEARDRPARLGRVLVPIAVVSVLFTAWLAFDIGGAALTRAVDNSCFLLVSGGTGLLMVRAAGRCTGATRRAWRLLAAASLIWCAGQVAWTLREGLSGTPAPFPSVADAGFLLSLPLAALGILTFPVGARNTPARLRRMVDGLIAATAMFILSWVLVVEQVVEATTDRTERTIALAYPFAGIAIGAVALMALSRVPQGRRTVLGLLAVGMLGNAAASVAFSVLQIDDSYRTGHLLDAVWLTSLCLLGAAAWLCRDDADVRGRTDDAPTIGGTLLVYLPIGAALVAGLATGRFFDGVASEVVSSAIVLVGLLAGRQVLTIAENVRLAETVQSAAAHYEGLVRNSSDLVLVTDGYDGLCYVSPSVERILGYRVENVLGTSMRPLIHPDDHGILDEITTAVLEDGAGRAELRVRDARRGTWRWIDAMATNLLGDPSIGGVVVNARDTTDRHQAEEALGHQAAHDPLTGLPNRAVVLDRLAVVPDGEPVAVLFCDLDGFKVINDSLGHDRGDEVLRAVAGRLGRVVRPGETVGRFGGDEFVLLCVGVADVGTAQHVAERVAATLRSALVVAGVEMVVSVSIGIRLAVGPCEPATLVTDADAAMYAAKAKGRGHIEVFDESLRRRAERRLTVEVELADAIAAGDLLLHYQPLWHLGPGGGPA